VRYVRCRLTGNRAAGTAYNVGGVACRRRQKKNESLQSTLVAAAHVDGDFTLAFRGAGWHP